MCLCSACRRLCSFVGGALMTVPQIGVFLSLHMSVCILLSLHPPYMKITVMGAVGGPAAKALAAKPDSLSLVPSTYTVERKN